MATSAVSSGGLDVATIVSQLMTVEQRPVAKLDAKVSNYNAKLSSLGLIKSQISGFQTAAQNLGGSGSTSLLAFTATSSDTTALTATADSTAVAGVYSLNVTTLAQAQKLAAAGKVSDTTAISAGASTVTFNVGGTSTNIQIAAGATLQDMRAAINSANIGVTATIVNDGSATPFRLALSSNNSGTSNAISSITVQAGGDSAVNDLLAFNPTANPPVTTTMAQTVAAQNAVFTVNGIPVTKSSNTISDAIQGVTLTLSKATSSTLTVSNDTSAVSSKVAAFVKSYNDLFSVLKNSTAFKSKAPLEGDSTVRSLQSQMRDIATSTVSGGTMSRLFEVGITFTASGTMQLDSAKLNSAMNTNLNDVANLFNSATGFATKFDAWATTTLAGGGTIDTKTQAINKSITDIGTERDKLQARLTGLQKQYTMQFTNVNTMLQSMSQTSAYLSRQLG